MTFFGLDPLAHETVYDEYDGLGDATPKKATPKKSKMGKGPPKKKGWPQHSDDSDFSNDDSDSEDGMTHKTP